MKINEMRAMPVSEAERQVAELRAELARERAVAAGGTRPENPGKIRGVRKNIARLLTVINEKKRAGEISGGKQAGAAEKKAPVARVAKKAGAVAKQVSQSFLQQQKGFAKAISPGFFSSEKKAVVHVAKKAATEKNAPAGHAAKKAGAVVKKVAAEGKFSPGSRVSNRVRGTKSNGFSMLPGKKAEKGKAKKGVKRA